VLLHFWQPRGAGNRARKNEIKGEWRVLEQMSKFSPPLSLSPLYLSFSYTRGALKALKATRVEF
jgi:hypothetical protein